jgi:hypothetical protein
LTIVRATKIEILLFTGYTKGGRELGVSCWPRRYGKGIAVSTIAGEGRLGVGLGIGHVGELRVLRDLFDRRRDNFSTRFIPGSATRPQALHHAAQRVRVRDVAAATKVGALPVVVGQRRDVVIRQRQQEFVAQFRLRIICGAHRGRPLFGGESGRAGDRNTGAAAFDQAGVDHPAGSS